MTEADAVDDDLRRRAEALLEPGEIELNGVIVHTDLTGDEEPTLHERTVEIGDHIAARAGLDPADTYVYSGNDDPEFGLNQHQGLTVEGDEFVWECQQLLRNGTYDVVFYYETDVDQAGVLEDVTSMGLRAVGIEG